VAETVGSLLEDAAAALSQAGVGEPRRMARRAVGAVLEISPVEMFSHPERVVEDLQVNRVRLTLGRMVAREPLSRILGRREFWGLEFALSADTLDPRPETETIVEAVLRRFPDRNKPLRLLDLGTGTGCIASALLSEFRNAVGFGVDLSAGAATTARRNADLLGFADRAHFLVGDWGAAVSGKFDAIIANPPYIPDALLAGLPREVLLHDPRLALSGGKDGLQAYRSLATELGRLLRPKAFFFGEIGLGQDRAVAEILRASGLVIDGYENDLAGTARCVVARADISAPQKRVGMRRFPV
jgi:release factor glutamine methyltransferase